VKAALGGSPGERAKLIRELVEKVIVDERTIIIKLRRGLLLGGDVASSASEAASDSAVELTPDPVGACISENARACGDSYIHGHRRVSAQPT
jgi:hypothetical protein